VTTPTIRSLLLQDYIKNPISMTSTWRWLKRLGFIYDTRKKSFFVDGHERQDVLVIRRNEFCKRYLVTQLEPCTHRWIQVTAETVEEWKREGKISEGMGGFKYTSADNTHMVEFHVDDLDFLHKMAEDMGFGLFGGNLSVRMPEGVKPLMNRTSPSLFNSISTVANGLVHLVRGPSFRRQTELV
jgi:DNA-binding transcriptional regulator YhcF (GntR family)